jgi:hypothetical protein
MCACLLAYLYSCGAPLTIVKDNAPVAKVAIGPKFMLLDVDVKKLSAVSNNDGQIHILAVSAESEQSRKLHYLTISKGEETSHKISDAEKYLENVSWLDFHGKEFTLDAALDSKHRLHAIIGKAGSDYDRQHLIFEKGEWQKLSDVRCERIARCGDDLVCAFRAGHKDLSRFGGGNSGLGKLVVAQGAEKGWLDWTVFDYPRPGYVWDFLIAGDNLGNLHTIYGHSHLYSLVYAQIRASADSNRNHDIDVKKKPASVSGTVLSKLIEPSAREYDITVDPNSGDGIIVSGPWQGSYLHISEGSRVSNPIQFIKGGYHGGVKIAPSGNGGFQAIIYYTEGASSFSINYKLAYIQYYENEWSQLNVLEEGFPWDLLFDIISDGSGNALVIWTEHRGNLFPRGYLFGRWVRQK